MAARSQWGIADTDRVIFYQPPIIRIELTLERPAPVFEFVADLLKRSDRRIVEQFFDVMIRERGIRNRLFDPKPSVPAMTGWIHAQLAEPSVGKKSIPATFQLLEVLAHIPRVP